MTSPSLEQLPQQAALEQAIKKHLGSAQMPEFSNYLFEKIVKRVDYEQNLKTLKPKLWAGVAVLAGSLGLLAFALSVFVKAFGQTPTSHFFALSFTDFGVVMANWQDFLLSILESLPLGALVFFLSACLASVFLIDFSKKQWSSFRQISHAYHH